MDPNRAKFVLDGGPWRHKGDALIVVPYDGFTRPSEVVIDSIDLWVRFYDVPAFLMTANFAGILARKVSNKVFVVGGPTEDFLRVKVSYLLEEALKPTVEVKRKGKGSIVFDVMYENVPWFCFRCGRMVKRPLIREDLKVIQYQS